MRFVIAVVAALTILTVGLITREIAGGPRAQAIAMLAALVAPTWLGLDFFYSMNAFDLLAWPAAVWLLLRALRLGTTTAWAWLGVALGLGLLNKISVLWLGAGIGAGLVISPQRRVLLTPGPYVAAGIAGALFAPHVIWQIANGWPTLEFIRNASANKMVLTSVGHYAAAQLQIVGPAAALVGIIGLVSLLRRRDDGRLSMLAIAWVVIFAILALNGTSRTGYMAPVYAWLLAGGGVAIERWTARRSGVWLTAIVTVLVLTGVGLAPLALPVLPVETYVRYARALGVAPSTEEKLDVAALPQFFADMNGWPAFVAGRRARRRGTSTGRAIPRGVLRRQLRRGGRRRGAGDGEPSGVLGAQQLLAVGAAARFDRRHRRADRSSASGSRPGSRTSSAPGRRSAATACRTKTIARSMSPGVAAPRGPSCGHV